MTSGFVTSGFVVDETFDHVIDELHDLEGTANEILDLATSGIDDFLPRLQFHIGQAKCIEASTQWTLGIEMANEAFQGGGAVRGRGVIASHPLDVFGSKSNDQPGPVHMGRFDLLAAMVGSGQADLTQGFAGSPADGLTIDGESAGGLDR